MKNKLVKTGSIIRFMLEGKSLQQARTLSMEIDSGIRMLKKRKDFTFYGSDLSDYTDEEIERGLNYISGILGNRKHELKTTDKYQNSMR